MSDSLSSFGGHSGILGIIYDLKIFKSLLSPHLWGGGRGGISFFLAI